MSSENIMAQAMALQKKIADAQKTLANTTVQGNGGNGGCVINMTGRYDVLNVTVDPELIKQGATAVADAVLAAYRDAKAHADEIIDRIMSQATAGIPMPE